MNFNLFFLFLLFLCNSALAEMVTPSTEFYTFWGGLKRVARTYWHKGGMEYLKDDSVLRKPLPIYLYQSEKKRPVIILFVGVFGRPDGIIVPGMIHDLEAIDAHILVIPSFISETYLNARRPSANKNIWDEEINYQISLVKSGLKMIGEDKISSLNVVAESLGVWQAVALLESNMKFNNFALLSPPLHLSHSVDRFDVLIEKNKKIYEDCSYWWKWPSLFTQYYTDKLPVKVEEVDNRCYGAWGIYNFLKGIKKVSQKVFKEQGLDRKIPESFRSFVELTTPDFLPFFKDHNDKLELYYWKKQLLEKSKNLVLISAADDFLNVKDEWKPFIEDTDLKEKVKLYPYGGHSGELGEKEFWPEFTRSLKLE